MAHNKKFPTRPLPTDRQLRVLRMIHDAVEGTGVGPTLKEIANGLGYQNIANANTLLLVLERLGLIEREVRKQRASRLTPEGKKMIDALDYFGIKLGPTAVRKESDEVKLQRMRELQKIAASGDSKAPPDAELAQA